MAQCSYTPLKRKKNKRAKNKNQINFAKKEEKQYFLSIIFFEMFTKTLKQEFVVSIKKIIEENEGWKGSISLYANIIDQEQSSQEHQPSCFPPWKWSACGRQCAVVQKSGSQNRNHENHLEGLLN